MLTTMIRPDSQDLNGHDTFVRPFTLTGGRTENEGVHVAIEAVVCQRRSRLIGDPDVGPIETVIYRLAAEQLSSAEMSARLRLPLGVVRVLIGDLVTAGHLQLGRTVRSGRFGAEPSVPATGRVASDVNLVKRLIDGIRSL